MAGLVPAIHAHPPPQKFERSPRWRRVDGRDKPGHDAVVPGVDAPGRPAFSLLAQPRSMLKIGANATGRHCLQQRPMRAGRKTCQGGDMSRAAVESGASENNIAISDFRTNL